MKVMSIDNVYEEDGLTNLLGFLNGLNSQPLTQQRDVLVAILPEYDEATGRLDRLDCITVPAADLGPFSPELERLIGPAADFTWELKARRQETQRQLDNSTIIVVKPTDKSNG